MIFYEAPHKLLPTLQDMAAAFGAGRRIALCRELTKLHEEVLRMTISEAAAYYEQQAPRGEYVLILEGAPTESVCMPSLEDGLTRANELIGQGFSRKDAVKQAANELNLSKNALYDALLRQEQH